LLASTSCQRVRLLEHEREDWSNLVASNGIELDQGPPITFSRGFAYGCTNSKVQHPKKRVGHSCYGSCSVLQQVHMFSTNVATKYVLCYIKCPNLNINLAVRALSNPQVVSLERVPLKHSVRQPHRLRVSRSTDRTHSPVPIFPHAHGETLSFIVELRVPVRKKATLRFSLFMR
jgi:hypothetical protein